MGHRTEPLYVVRNDQLSCKLTKRIAQRAVTDNATAANGRLALEKRDRPKNGVDTLLLHQSANSQDAEWPTSHEGLGAVHGDAIG